MREMSRSLVTREISGDQAMNRALIPSIMTSQRRFTRQAKVREIEREIERRRREEVGMARPITEFEDFDTWSNPRDKIDSIIFSKKTYTVKDVMKRVTYYTDVIFDVSEKYMDWRTAINVWIYEITAQYSNQIVPPRIFGEIRKDFNKTFTEAKGKIVGTGRFGITMRRVIENDEIPPYGKNQDQFNLPYRKSELVDHLLNFIDELEEQFLKFPSLRNCGYFETRFVFEIYQEERSTFKRRY